MDELLELQLFSLRREPLNGACVCLHLVLKCLAGDLFWNSGQSVLLQAERSRAKGIFDVSMRLDQPCCTLVAQG